jgi:hypothetical protein
MKLSLDKPVSLAAPVSTVELAGLSLDLGANVLRIVLGAPGQPPSRIVAAPLPPAVRTALAAIVKAAVGEELGAVATEAAEVKP